MKRFFGFLIFSAALFCFSAGLVFAQSVKVADVKGAVMVRRAASSNWEKAKINMLLGKDAEIETAKDSLCTLALDDELENIFTVQENSKVKLESIIPAKLFLPEGRVFSLIDNLSRVEKFEVRTPTAVAGARGTGLSVEFSGGKTTAKCYKHSVYVDCLDKQGKPSSNISIAKKQGISIGPGCEWEGPFALSAGDYKDWKSFMALVDEIRGDDKEGGEGGFEDGREGFGDPDYEKRRWEIDRYRQGGDTK